MVESIESLIEELESAPLNPDANDSGLVDIPDGFIQEASKNKKGGKSAKSEAQNKSAQNQEKPMQIGGYSKDNDPRGIEWEKQLSREITLDFKFQSKEEEQAGKFNKLCIDSHQTKHVRLQANNNNSKPNGSQIQFENEQNNHTNFFIICDWIISKLKNYQSNSVWTIGNKSKTLTLQDAIAAKRNLEDAQLLIDLPTKKVKKIKVHFRFNLKTNEIFIHFHPAEKEDMQITESDIKEIQEDTQKNNASSTDKDTVEENKDNDLVEENTENDLVEENLDYFNHEEELKKYSKKNPKEKKDK